VPGIEVFDCPSNRMGSVGAAKANPPRSPGRDHDPAGLQPRASGGRALRSALGPVDFNAAVLHVRRVKNGTLSTHPLRGDELRALRRVQRGSETSPFVFVSEWGSPFITAGFARLIERAAAGASLDLKTHPPVLSHSCGHALANEGHDTRAIQAGLGHRSITSTAIYTALAQNRFKDFRRDRCECRKLRIDLTLGAYDL
jgi:integrase